MGGKGFGFAGSMERWGLGLSLLLMVACGAADRHDSPAAPRIYTESEYGSPIGCRVVLPVPEGP